MYSTMALDLVGFLPTTDSEVIAKRNNHQHEKRLLCQLRGIERQEKFSRAIINKSNTVLKQHIMLKRNKPETSSAGYSSAPMPRLPSNYQGCLRITENSTRDLFVSLNRRTFKDDSLYFKQNSQTPTGYEKIPTSKHRDLSRAHSTDSTCSRGGSVKNNRNQTILTKNPKWMTQSLDVTAPTHDRAVRVRSATHMDLATRYNKWCDSIDKMNNDIDNSDNIDYQKGFSSSRRRRSNTISDPEDIRLEDVNINEQGLVDRYEIERNEIHAKEEKQQQYQKRKTSLPRPPDTTKPPSLSGKQRLFRISSLPTSIVSPVPFPRDVTKTEDAPVQQQVVSCLVKNGPTKKQQQTVSEEVSKQSKTSAQSDAQQLLLSMTNDTNNNSEEISMVRPKKTRDRKKPLKVSRSWEDKNFLCSSTIAGNALPKINKIKLRMTKSVQ